MLLYRERDIAKSKFVVQAKRLLIAFLGGQSNLVSPVSPEILYDFLQRRTAVSLSL